MAQFRRRSSAESPSRLGRAVSVFRKLSPHRRPVAEDKAQEDGDPGDDIKGPLGLNLLWDVAEPQIDFIFVHGLGGGSRKTWSASSDPGLYWPKVWLAEDQAFGCVRIHSFGYAADWVQRKESFLNIRDFARSLINAIYCDPNIGRSKTKVVLVAHSLGGIVAKKAFMSAREDSDFRELADRIHTIYFLATPHRGANLAKTLESILKVSYPKSYVPELRPNSETIASINDSFRHVGKHLNLWSFYEKQKTTIAKKVSVLIVDESSATLGYEKEKPVPLDADHRTICKFQTPDDHNYRTLRNNFVRTIEDITAEVSEASLILSDLRRRQLVQLTGVSEPPVDELLAFEDTRAPGTCDWLSTRKPYITWRTSQLDSKPIFWLTGNAGFGKSYLSSYVIKEIQKSPAKCSFFFFRKGIATKSTISDCLRSLAHQMAANDGRILSKLLEAQPSLDKWDERTIWRKLFVECIFMHMNTSSHIWVLDALDECQRFSVLVNFLVQVPPELKIFLTSRSNQETDRDIEKLDLVSLHYQMQPEDTVSDFAILIRSKMDRVPVSDEEGHKNLEAKILSKASGSFLWVSLVIQRLEQAYSQEEVEEILNEVPTDMNELYRKILEELLRNPRGSKLARSIFSWTLLSLRPLKVEELQVSIKLDVNQTVRHLEKSISAICGQLVCINLKGEVEIIHQTAKTYLSQQRTYPGLALKKQEDHTRIAQICLETLLGSFHYRSQWSPDAAASLNLNQNHVLLSYASEFFSDHLQKSSSEEESTWDLLCKFLLRNPVLAWVEYSARKGGLGIILRTAKNLQVYLKRRVKYLSPLDQDKETLAMCINDLAKLSAKFGTFLMTSPSSIHTLIPAMCPSESKISKAFESSHIGLVLRGHKDESWDDCLLRIDYPTSQTSALAFGDRYSGVGMADGTILLYCHDSTNEHQILNHGERIKLLAFSTADEYLASSGLRTLKVWNPAKRAQLWAFDTQHQALSLMFLSNGLGLTAATQGNYTTTWIFGAETDTRQWDWIGSIQDTAGVNRPRQQPAKALFSSDHSVLAVAYRGLPIYLFNMRTLKFMGCCIRETTQQSSRTTSHYSIDALAFNSSPEINVLISSYGDGELAVYDVESTELRFRSPDIFAHCLAASPDCRTLVTGSSRGTIQVFEFGGTRGDRLSLIYRIKAYEDGIRAIAFSGDSLRFADIRGSQYRVWEPDLLVSNEQDEGSQSDLSQAVTLLTKSTSMLEGPPESEIMALCCHPNGGLVFAGKQDGSVVYFDTESATEGSIIYRHATNTGVTAIAFAKEKSILMTADESGRVLVSHITISGSVCTLSNQIEQLRVQDSVMALLINPVGSSFLVQGKNFVFPFTIEGKMIAPPITLFAQDEMILTNHPLRTEHFLTLDYQQMHSYNWSNANKVQSTPRKPSIPSINITEFNANQNIDIGSHPQTHQAFNQVRQSSKLIAYFSKPNKPSTNFLPTLLFFRASEFTSSSSSLSGTPPTSIDIPDLPRHVHKIRQIIAVSGTTLLFLDTSFWLCSFDTLKSNSLTLGTKRHFFLLPEWQCVDGTFIIEYLEARREFVVVRKGGILVFGRGLEAGEAWVEGGGELMF
ncbi:hypothetical protein B0O99DRAFT_315745 [Bisporella sp. PMI_857]|nr:hypothetical protein B0O99DRAFT_315745 [Bisporella sp. PMI_857]